jgi:hypothetical protein
LKFFSQLELTAPTRAAELSICRTRFDATLYRGASSMIPTNLAGLQDRRPSSGVLADTLSGRGH